MAALRAHRRQEASGAHRVPKQVVKRGLIPNAVTRRRRRPERESGLTHKSSRVESTGSSGHRHGVEHVTAVEVRISTGNFDGLIPNSGLEAPGVFSPTSVSILAVVYCSMDSVSSKNPCAPSLAAHWQGPRILVQQHRVHPGSINPLIPDMSASSAVPSFGRQRTAC